MLVTTPHKKKQAKPNVRRAPSRPADGNGSARKRNGSNGKARSGAGRTANGASNGTGSPGHGRRIKKENGNARFSLPHMKPWKVILGAIVIGLFGLLYLNHVFATQELLQEVQNLEREYNQVRRTNEDLRLNYDRMIGPADIYGNAKGLGFINGGPAEKVIEVERDE